MGIVSFLAGLFDKGRPVEELAARLGLAPDELRDARVSYRSFSIPKRSGGTRTIHAPDEPSRKLQRRILVRLLSRLRCHAAAEGFERRHSIVTNAKRHTRKAVVVRLDLVDFFTSTSASRVEKYFRGIGWNRESASILARLCTRGGGLPQGAPTSPRLSNLVNCRFDGRLSALASSLGAAYTRYADDLTFSFEKEDAGAVRLVIELTKKIAAAEGYRVHTRRKLHVRRCHCRQEVTGLVVNDTVNLPRRTRRWLRAVRHRAASGGNPTLSPAQLAGWRAFESMIAAQR